jgi:WD40 repeat protein
MKYLIGWLLGVCSFVQSDTSSRVRVLHEEVINPTGGASFISGVDAHTILTVDSRRTINLWEIEEKWKVKQLVILPTESIFRSFDYCQFSRTFAYSNSNSVNNELFFYSITDARQFVKKKHIKLPFADGPTMAFRFSPQGNRFAYSSHKEEAIKILDGNTLEPTQLIRWPHYVEHLSFLDESLLLAVAGNDQACIWDLNESPPKCLSRFILPKNGHQLLGVTVNGDEKKAVVYYVSKPRTEIGSSIIDFSSTITVTNQSPSLLRLAKPGWVFCVSPRLKNLVIGDTDGNLTVIDLVNSKVLLQRKLDDIPWSAVFFNADNHFLVGCLNGRFYSFSIEP